LRSARTAVNRPLLLGQSSDTVSRREKRKKTKNNQTLPARRFSSYTYGVT
jgi:hypothetical protein